MNTRYISVENRRGLRREVNFGCPVSGCGSPYLSYHHFDPPVAEGGGDDPAGIIAVCLHHHRAADIGTYTKDQLREIKKNPFLGSPEAHGILEWRRREVVFRMGAVTYLRPEVLLQGRDRRLIWVERDAMGYLLLNMDIPGSDGESILKMEQNDWVVTGNLADLEVAPSGRNISVLAPQRDLEISIRFKDLEQHRFHQDVEDRARQGWLQSQIMLKRVAPRLSSEAREELAQTIGTPAHLAKQWWKQIEEAITSWPALEVIVEGHLPWPKSIDISPGLTKLEGGAVLGDVTIIGGTTGGIAIQISGE